ncbi:hypothetical protein P5P86_10820 [Nocardioides sp. BP30]|uniref:hypothetical protein n=1 Tax=Nocardioides sp. BP30 TaxID=3036374 RepID=UPI0024690B6F|nr:hypothetical protein [Nocardioides sp. BP30]WGL50460.1 hypothetical protein P5P86_10820 [Nocardioides sp. BP30]
MTHLIFRASTRRRSASNLGRAVAGAVLVAGLAGLAACGGSSADAYCGSVKDNQAKLSKILGNGGEAALIDALPTFRTLQAKAPGDIRPDWDVVVKRLSALQGALSDAGIDPDTYDAKKPPAGVSAAQQQAVAAAATALGSAATATALDAVQQQARDVCHTPLSL